MRRFAAISSFAVLALAFTACSASSEATRSPAVLANGALGFDCPCCFTIVECMRNGVGVECDEVQTVRCERCCEQLTFTKIGSSLLLVSTTRTPEPMPVQSCMPMPPR
jgi:hypothetical protein